MNTPPGKGFYIWNLQLCAAGDPARLAQRARDAGLSHVSIKVQDGIAPYTKLSQADLLPDALAALREAGIVPWGWGYLYGQRWYKRDGAKREAEMTAVLVERYRLAGFHLDIEPEWKDKNAAQWASIYLSALRARQPELALGLSSYRFPSLHPEPPWHTFLNECTHHYPQVYWEGSHNADAQLARSYKELTALRALPVIPAGAAYAWQGWQATPADVKNFMDMARALELPGVSFWSWEHAERIGLWDTIAAYDWPSAQPPAPGLPATLEQRVQALEARVLALEQRFS